MPKLQMIIVLVALALVGYAAVKLLPDTIGFTQTLRKSGE